MPSMLEIIEVFNCCTLLFWLATISSILSSILEITMEAEKDNFRAGDPQ